MSTLSSRAQPKAGGLSEFFRYHGAWAPGVRLFRAIGFRAKAMVIALTFLVPMAVLGWSYFADKADAIAFSAKERVSVEYARAPMPVLDLMQRQRMAALLKAAGGDVERTLAAQDGALPALVDRLGASTDGSNLTLDPDIDTYYLMDTSTFRLPAMDGQVETTLLGSEGAHGDLTTCLRAWGRDEPARLMGTLEQMQQSLRRIVAQVRAASDNLVQASGEIASGSADLSDRTERTAASLQQTAATMDSIVEAVDHNLGTAERANRLTGTSAEVAERGGAIIGRVVETMDTIQEGSRRIADITGTIDGIAFQTNILALNAAVEAARAGEQGRRFAVVASEVRALAQRSAAAAREIKDLIGRSVGQVESGHSVVREAGGTMEEIVSTARQVRELLDALSTSARTQAGGVGEATGAMRELDSSTQQNAALVEQTAAAAQALREQAHRLAGEVSRFRLPALA